MAGIGSTYSVSPVGTRTLATNIPTRDPELVELAKKLALQHLNAGAPRPASPVGAARPTASTAVQRPQTRPAFEGSVSQMDAMERSRNMVPALRTAYGTTPGDLGPRRALPTDPNGVAGGYIDKNALALLPQNSNMSSAMGVDDARRKSLDQAAWWQFLRQGDINDSLASGY